MIPINLQPAVSWWRTLQPSLPDGTRNPTSDRAALAMLRRADLLSAMEEPATFALFRKLRCSEPGDLPRVALCAAVLAAVREDRPEHPARRLGAPLGEPPEKARMKPLRFRRLMEADTPEERLTVLRRAVQLADRKISVRGLADACLNWSDDLRRTWIFEYYGAGRAAPEAETIQVGGNVP
jgi:CRISPR system Cascade subunit CasB